MGGRSVLLRGLMLVALFVLSLTHAATAAADPHALDALTQAVMAKNWSKADMLASDLDRRSGSGDFYKAYADATHLIDDGKCPSARPLLMVMRLSQPYFLPTYELLFVCDKAAGDPQSALADLDALIAALPPGPQRELVTQIRQNEAGLGRPAISLYGDIMPSSNADRQTSATSLQEWTISDASRGHAGVLVSGGAAVSETLLRKGSLTVGATLRGDVAYSTANSTLWPSLTAEAPVTFQAPFGIAALVAPYVSVGFANTTLDTRAIGLRFVASYQFSPSLNLAWSNRASYSTFEKTTYRDGVEYDSEVSLISLLSPNTRLTGTLALDGEYTNDPDWRFIDVWGSLRADQLFQNGIVLGVTGTVGRRYHSQPPPLSTGSNQVDTYFAGRVEVSHRAFTIGPFMPSLYYQYTNQVSDSVFYTYQSHDIGIGLRAKL